MLQLFSRKTAADKSRPKVPPPPIRKPDAFEPAEPIELDADPLNQCMQLGRFGHLLVNRETWKDHPEIERIWRTSRARIDEMFAIVPDGIAVLSQAVRDSDVSPEIAAETEPFLLARHVVTNADFQRFADGGGYGQLDLWPKDIWPHLIDFKDPTEHPGPRYWRKGRHSKHLSDHPVVGICFYEASAYARWAGFRLPTEAEWQVAATWRIRSEANVLRRFPWGDAFDTQRCNIWASGIGHTVPVADYPNGAGPNQVCQMVGNIWEWTAGDFGVTDDSGNLIAGDMRMAAIRGGAFDTYFSSQATGVFRTGLVCLARAHNVGFRCALDLGDETAGAVVVKTTSLAH